LHERYRTQDSDREHVGILSFLSSKKVKD